MLSERFGAKLVVTLGMVPVAVLTLLTPILARVHYIALIVLRVLIGLGQVSLSHLETPNHPVSSSL